MTPDGYECQETGRWITTDAVVEGSAGREMAQAREVREQSERFEPNENGSQTYNNQASDADIQNLIAHYGGQEVFNDVQRWASAQFSEQDFAGYNAIIESGDINAIAEAMETVYRLYDSRNEEAQMPAVENDDYTDDARFIFENVIPEAEYDQLTAYAVQNFDDEFIDQFNTVMDSGNREMIVNTINLLRSKVNA